MMSYILKNHKMNMILIVLCLLFTSTLLAQFPQGFEGGTIPSTWTVYNVDGDTKQFTAVNNGANSYEGTWTADVGWNTSGNDDWLVTPQINVTSNQKVLKFYARSTSASFLEDFNIKLSETGNAVADFTVTLGSYTQIPNAWNEYIVDLSNYIGDTVYLAVQCVSNNRWYFRVDGFDWVVGDDMAALSISGPNSPTVNTANDYIVTVKNNSGNAQNNYTVKLYVNDTEYQTQTGTTIASGATAQHTFSWTPAAAQNYILKGEVVLEGDDNPANDITPDYTVIVQPEGTASVTVGDPNTTTTSNSYPINYFYKSSISQTLYMQDELNIGGAITMFKYYANLDGAITGQKPLKVWMANTAQTEFASTSAWLPLSDFTLVFDGTIDFTGLSGEVELSIPLATPFAYAGGNLCLMVNRPLDGQYYSTSNKFKTTATANYPNRLMYVNSDTVEYNPSALPTGTRVGIVPNTTFSISTAGLATLEGNVTFNGAPISQVTVSIDGTPRSTTTNAQGHYQFDYLTPGTVSITASKVLFNDAHVDDIVLVADETTTQDVELSLMSIISASGLVVDSETGDPVEDAIVKMEGIDDYETTTDATGAFTFPAVFSGQTYALSVLKVGYEIYRESINIGVTNHTIPTINLNPVPSIVESMVGNPNSTTAAYYYPANFFYKSSISQTIYMANELQGDYYLDVDTPITSIKYYANLNGDIPANKPLKIWMANTTQSSISSTTSWIPQNNFTLVYDGTVNLNMSGANEIEIEFDEPFLYAGNNLAIMIIRPLDTATSSSLNTWKNTATPQYTNRTIYRMSDSVDQNLEVTTAGTLVSAVPNTMFNFVTSGFATMSGTVTTNGAPLEGVKVAVQGTNRFAMTNASGEYSMEYLAAGTVTIVASKSGYDNEYVEDVVLVAEENTVLNISMTTMTNVTISGQVNNETTGQGVENAIIQLLGYADYEVFTDATGAFTIPQVFSGQTYTLKALKPGYTIYTQEVIVGTTDLVIPTINIEQGPSMVDAYVGNPNTTTRGYYYPANFFYKSSISQAIYMADEFSSDVYIGGGAPITNIKYYANLNGDIPENTPIKIWAANTELSSFSTTTSWIPENEFTLVFDGTLDLSASGSQEVAIEFDEPFPYEGNNLVLMVIRPLDSGCYSLSNTWKNTATPAFGNRTLYRQSDTVDQNLGVTTAGTFASAVPNTMFSFATAGFASLTGTVSDANGPVANARVAVVGTNRFATTNTQGQYQMSFVPAGTVSLKTTCQGYNDQYTEGVVLVAEENTVQNITLTPMTQISITGFVKNATTQAGIQAAEIRLIGYENYSAVTTNTGAFTFPSIYSGQTYQLKVLKPGCQFYTMDLTVGTTNMTVPDILVNQSPATVEAYVGNPNSTTSINSYPINLYWKNSYTQALYMQDEISSEYYLGGGSPIYSIKYYANLYGGAPSASPIKIWIGNTSLSSFTNTSSWVNVNDMTLVFDGTLDFSQAGQQEFEIVLDEPFPYEGENLVIAVLRPLDGDCYSLSNKWYYTATPQYNNRLLYYNSDSTEANPASPPVGNLASNVPNTLFSINTSGFATLVGNTTANNAPLAGVKVAIDGTNRFATSDAQGNYALGYAPAGQNSITASKFGYYDNTVQLNMPADEITTQNFNLTQLPNVTVTGVVHGSDTGAGLSNATVSLTGYEDYQVTTNANGEFTIPGVYAAQTYTIGIVRAGYQNYTGQAVVGDTNTNLGTLVMSEIAYPVTNVFAEISNNTIILSWNAPQVPNGVADDSRREGSLSATGLSKASSHKIVISKDAFTGNALTINKDNVTTTQMGVIGNNTNFKEKTNYTRALTGYTIWRTPLEGVDNQDFWTSIQNNYDGLSYADQSWGQCPSGEYKYVVSATYTGNVLAEPVFSNTVAKDMMASVTFNLSTADGQTAAGAVVTLENTDGNPEHAYTATATGNVVVIPNVWLGIYDLTITKSGYMPYTHNNLVINQIEYTYPTVINLQISNIFFQEGFEGTAFPPAGWTLIDADGDGNNWFIGGGVQIPAHSGDKCVTSASYDNNTGALTPDNYLITPMVSLATNATSYNIKYWVAPQDPAYYNESYSLMISTTGTNIADFTTLISETLTNTEWVQRTYPLDSYIGQNVFIAFRHHNSTDIYMIKIDDIEIDRTLASDPEVIVPVITQTVLKGNYPNPFNPETSIAFDLATEGNVSIDIYNAKGQKVKTLVNDRYGVGAHSVVWNGKDDNGKNVGSGIYFFNMKSGKYTSTRKMILMK